MPIQSSVTAQEQEQARRHLAALKRDKAFMKRWLDGDKDAVRTKSALEIMISLPVTPQKGR